MLAFDRADEEQEEINIQAIPILKDPRILAAAVEANRQVLTPLWLELIREGRIDGAVAVIMALTGRCCGMTGVREAYMMREGF